MIKGVINKTRKIESITGSSEYLLMQDIGNKTKGYIRKLNMFADSSAFFYETNPDSSRHYTRLNKIYSDSIRYAEIEFIKVNSHSTYSLHLLNSYLFSIKKDSVKKILSNFDHTIRKLNLFKQIDEYVMTDGRRLLLIAEGRLVNLGAAEGHPASVMDMSFSDQALTAEYLVKEAKNLPAGIHNVPTYIDKEVASLKLSSMGGKIDVLTPAQDLYLNSWEHGS